MSPAVRQEEEEDIDRAERGICIHIRINNAHNTVYKYSFCSFLIHKYEKKKADNVCVCVSGGTARHGTDRCIMIGFSTALSPRTLMWKEVVEYQPGGSAWFNIIPMPQRPNNSVVFLLQCLPMPKEQSSRSSSSRCRAANTSIKRPILLLLSYKEKQSLGGGGGVILFYFFFFSPF